MIRQLPIFRKWPSLAEHVAHVPLTQLPTPVVRLDALGKAIGLSELWVKKDDQCSDVFGGNKPRKLEFVLSEALKRKKRWVVTRGGMGSNHCLATAIFARQLGMECTLFLAPQPITDEVRTRLLLYHRFGARMVFLPYRRTKYWVALTAMLHTIIREKGRLPYNIAPGGSSVLGTLGYVNAGMELMQQVEDGVMPQPDYVVHASGSSGTLAGLLVAFKLLKFPTRLIGVRIVSSGSRWARTECVLRLAKSTHELLRRSNEEIGPAEYNHRDFMFVDGLYGSKYGEPTLESQEAVQMAWELEGIPLDFTYTGKAMVALRKMVANGGIGKGTILFWNTFSGVDLSHLVANFDYHRLPSDFHLFFEQTTCRPIPRGEAFQR